MIIRLTEQLLASGGTFATSMVALRVLDPELLSVFFLLICGSQIAVVVLAARRISIFVQAPTSVSHMYLVGRRAIIEVAVASVFVTLAAMLLLHRSLDALHIDWGMVFALSAFSLAQLLAEWFRRAYAVIFAHSFPFALLAAQFFKLSGLLLFVTLSVGTARDPSIFFSALSVSSLLAIGTYVYLFRSAHLRVLIKQPFDSSTGKAVTTIDKRVLLETYYILAWTNIPITVLAMIGGSLGVARLVEVRTPLSFFNPAIEFIEVHIRQLTGEHLQYRRIWLKAAALFGFWLIVSALILRFGDQATSIIAGRPVSGIAFDMLIFWWLQLVLIIDRLTHNMERTEARRHPHITLTLAVGLALLFLTIILINQFNVTGCIIAMCIWCSANILARFFYKK